MSVDPVLQKMHRLQLTLADEMKRICEKHHIRYFMIAGTLLGAVRHKGFIPWDDDMDFGMPRLDFDRFVAACRTELDSARFYLQTEDSEANYPFNFAKLQLVGTHVQESFSQDAGTQCGIYIDIFPIDNVAVSPLKKKIQFRGFWLFRSLLWTKSGYGRTSKQHSRKYRIARLLSTPFPIRFLKSMKRRMITMCKNEQTPFVVVSDGSYGLKHETLDAKWIASLKNYPFDDRVFPGIADADAYLTYFYGDYMKLPPEDKQNKHTRYAVDFGRYEKGE